MHDRRSRGPKRPPGATELEEQRDAEEAARREHGIDLLREDEELIDEQSFARMHEQMARARAEADGGVPDAADPADDELLLQEIISEPTQRAEPEPASGERELPAASPGEVAALEAKLLGATDRDEVARLALRIARVHAQGVALFVVHEGVIMGLRGAGDELEERIEGVLIPATADSLFARVVSAGRPARFGGSSRKIDQRVLRALGRADALERLLVPIAIRGRVVNLLYADNGQDALAETSSAALRALGGCVARAYERLILERKRRRRD